MHPHCAGGAVAVVCFFRNGKLENMHNFAHPIFPGLVMHWYRAATACIDAAPSPLEVNLANLRIGVGEGIYFLFVGEKNGIEWRVHIDPMLTLPTGQEIPNTVPS